MLSQTHRLLTQDHLNKFKPSFPHPHANRRKNVSNSFSFLLGHMYDLRKDVKKNPS